MKKFLCFIICVLSVLLLSVTALAASTDDSPAIYRNGRLLTFENQSPAWIQDGVTIVSISKLANVLECFFERTDTAWICYTEDTTVMISSQDDSLIVNGTPSSLVRPVQITDDICFVPLRQLCNLFGAEIDWDASAGAAYITLERPAMKCTHCGNYDTVPLLYGAPSPGMFDVSLNRDIQLGGCVLPSDTDDIPERHCWSCGMPF
jgi:hypothetical protein